MVQTETSDEAYAEDTPLTYLFGTPARTKIVGALVSETDHDLNTSDIARLAGVARSTVYDHLDELEALGLVEETRTVGGSPMYQLDTDDELVEHIARIEGLVLKRLLELEGQL
ncbi:winged helix-turn-helix domain-containing protein [Halorarum halobium]|uniref:winged helix-turn-helix domain-containing protein n=1 Tax=Halorarum halobium TaxID=3075121 RepID=UPI0028AAF1B2|nr:winged helix-turn-helix domain-containing protein [Halobaculum sp. XH14]